MSCAKCERPFRYGTEDTVTINKKTYHSDCLSCDNCSKAYDGSFLPDQLDQQALCRECSNMNQTKSAMNLQSASSESKNNVLRCGGCGIPFNPSSRHITKKYRNREYHHNCLKCHECQALIEGEIYEDEQNTKIYCTSCFKRRDQQGFQKQNQQKKLNQQKTVHFAEKLAETLNRDELEAYYKNDQGHSNDSFLTGIENSAGGIKFCAACMLPFHYGSRITEANGKEYHYECFSCKKCAQPINGTYTMTPDGSTFTCGSCLQKVYSSTPIMLCAECGQPIEPHVHARVTFNNRSFHSECFSCAVCRRQLNPSQAYTLHNDQPWCHQCEVDTKTCYVCGKPILAAGITYETREYHAECFKCSHCHKSLDNENLLCANNLQPYCVPCNEILFAKRCAKCAQPIPFDKKYTVIDDKPYHEHCFLCVKCHRQIGSKKFFKDPRGFVCSNCGKA
ncbi:unnamed protein product [Rotaria socialis]|uniref:LIM zinc-binding domain-containing protein n=1 Tax=Rotaria socialis TaxID=392032 RepID=A0A818C0T6_9BILA|nr:unnamed protein product [Rotaria socialis]CAF3586568.1 unnamed protein product [Rotaria socialis]CAF4146279.1 unnamed protein product [Rotaria socialis]CAF4459712.1 unnamed protein product [Rotaria socialis]